MIDRFDQKIAKKTDREKVAGVRLTAMLAGGNSEDTIQNA